LQRKTGKQGMSLSEGLNGRQGTGVKKRGEGPGLKRFPQLTAREVVRGGWEAAGKEGSKKVSEHGSGGGFFPKIFCFKEMTPAGGGPAPRIFEKARNGT